LIFRSSGVQEFRSSGVQTIVFPQEFRSSGVQTIVFPQEFRSSGVQTIVLSIVQAEWKERNNKKPKEAIAG